MEQQVKEVVLDAAQDKAVSMCGDLRVRLVAVTGPAGSGKTTTIRTVYEKLRKKGTSVVLAAPTGKAARRIKEATGIDAVTVHKLLEYARPGERDPETGKPLDPSKPRRNNQNRLDYKVVIVDEYAMINYELHEALMAALPSGGCLRAFGDIHQLPPIDLHGSQVIDSRKATKDTPFQKLLAREGGSIVLSHVYRQAQGSNILEMAERITRGWSIQVNKDLGDYYVKITDKPIPVLKDYVIKGLESGMAHFGSIDSQIITPGRKSWVGTHNLNTVLRQLLNPNPKQRINLPRHDYDKLQLAIGIGDKVVCTENTYDLRPYFERYSDWDNDHRPVASSYIDCPVTKQMLNGETGIVTAIYPDGAVDIDFGDRTVEVPAKLEEYWQERDTIIDVYPLRAIDLAYALTTHKCQGSEFKNVIYVLNKTTIYNQGRQNFYTALTRAKEHVFVITDQDSLRMSIQKVIK